MVGAVASPPPSCSPRPVETSVFSGEEEEGRKVVHNKLSPDFRSATTVVSMPIPIAGFGEVLVRLKWAGVNASDVNLSAGRYSFSNSVADSALSKPPFDAGFESVGVVLSCGAGVESIRPGDAVGIIDIGGFATHRVVAERNLLRVPEASPEYLSLLVSGLTASLALEQAGEMQLGGQVVLVTAGAGGAGQVAVQLAKIAGNTVFATCGGKYKAQLLRDLGVDRVIDHHEEDVGEVLRRECSKGVDLVYESVGGTMFRVALDNLAPKGRIVVVGMMSNYTAGKEGRWNLSNYKGMNEILLRKSASVHGFFLPHYKNLYQQHLKYLCHLVRVGKLRIAVDPVKFSSLECAADAGRRRRRRGGGGGGDVQPNSILLVEHLQSGFSRGKVVLRIDADNESMSKTYSRL